MLHDGCWGPDPPGDGPPPPGVVVPEPPDPTLRDIPAAHPPFAAATARYVPAPRWWKVPWKRPEWLLFTLATETHLLPRRVWSRTTRLRMQLAFGELNRPAKRL